MIKKFDTYIKESINTEDLIGTTVIMKEPDNAIYTNTKRSSYSRTGQNLQKFGKFFIQNSLLEIGDRRIIKDFIVYKDKILFRINDTSFYYNLDNFILPKRIFSENDPYGEEEWENENVNENIENNELIGKIAVLAYADDALYVKKQDGGGRVQWMMRDTVNKPGWSFKIKTVIKNESTTLIGDGHAYFFYDLDNFDTEEAPKRIYTKEDPYGEEDWNNESVNENLETQYLFGKIAILRDAKNALHTKIDINTHHHCSRWITKNTQQNPGWGFEIKIVIVMEHFTLIGDGGSDRYFYDLDNFDIKEKRVKKQIFTEEDPYGEEEWENESLNYFPHRTSVSQISFGLKVLVNKIRNEEIKEVEYNLDYGGGRYDLGTRYLDAHGIKNLIYDKYNRSEEHNKEVLNQIKEMGGVDSVTLLNTLNVIKEKETRLYCIKHAYSFLKPEGVMIITVYIGDNTGTGTLSGKKTWQENRSTISYVNEIKESLGNEIDIKIDRRCIMIRKPLNESFSLKTEKGSTIKRSKYGVGKDIGDSIYVLGHYSTDVIAKDALMRFIRILSLDFKNFERNYTEFIGSLDTKIIKIKKDLSSISIINSPDFNTSDEPLVKNWLNINIDKTVKYGESNPANPPIYHHKWLFVKDDYEGFDVEESKRRSELWLSIPDIDFSKIGHKKYWEENIVPKIND